MGVLGAGGIAYAKCIYRNEYQIIYKHPATADTAQATPPTLATPGSHMAAMVQSDCICSAT